MRKYYGTPRPCHCEEQRDAAIHRVSKDAFGGCGSLTEGQWIATGYALAMKKARVVKIRENALPHGSVIARKTMV